MKRLFPILLFSCFSTLQIMAQQMVRIAKVKVDPAKLAQYNAALKEQMNAAISLEPGVLTYYAVADKKDPSSITILEIYADTNAYHLHTQAPHFLKYKATVQSMVTALELTDVDMIAFRRKDQQ